jgi:transcriptional regulator, XRE family
MLGQEAKHYNGNMRKLNYLQIGQNIKTLRSEVGLTQEKMAEICEISTSFLGHIERGTRKLSLETAVKIADCLQISMDALLMDGKKTDFSVLSAADAILRKQDSTTQQHFLCLIKVLSQHIDEL